MRTLKGIEETRAAVLEMRRAGRRVGFVPTMGALHGGHLALVEAALGRCDAVVVSIFVNPTQFGPGEDFERYPRPVEADLAACARAGVELVFLPSVEDMYPAGAVTTVRVAGLAEGLCGAHRPGHFDGVTTVVCKLFQVAPADAAFFGEKDYQQLRVIERMVRDLNIPIEIVGCPTVRDDDGLAVSSRNAYLSADDRKSALSLSGSMRAAIERFDGGECDAAVLEGLMRSMMEGAGVSSIDYVSIVDAVTLEPLTRVDRAARICVAARVGSCRLIDNMRLGAKGPSG